jgi:hypothetical protein
MTKHIHKYINKKLGTKGYRIYKCVLPNCTHFIAENLVIGRQSICWRCDAVFIITKLHKKPHCNDCIKGHKQEVDDGLLQHFENILKIG